VAFSEQIAEMSAKAAQEEQLERMLRQASRRMLTYADV
jgi:hypothetical protein